MSPGIECSPSIAIADFNRDGVPDLAVATEILSGFGPAPPVAGHVYVALGKGNGSFSSPVAALALNQTAYFITAADFNRDGTPDLALGIGTTLVFLGNGDGSFRSAPSINLCCSTAGSIAVADWTKSGNLGLGLYTLTGTPGIGIMGGNGDGTFYAAGTAAVDPHSFPGYQFSSGDVNGEALVQTWIVSAIIGEMPKLVPVEELFNDRRHDPGLHQSPRGHPRSRTWSARCACMADIDDPAATRTDHKNYRIDETTYICIGG